MPYPNEHSCRLIDPAKCKADSFQRETGGGAYNGKKYDIIWAEMKDSGRTVQQSSRYPKDNFSESEAKTHCASVEGIKFEPASGSAQMPQIFSQPWAISEFGLEMVRDATSEIGTIQAILARQGDRPRDSALTQIRDGVAVIEVIGPIFHYENILTWITGFPSAEGLMQEIQSAADNPQVKSIVLQVDSPGGQVGGVSELSDFIKSVEKPVIAYVGDMAASAAYWIASAANEIVAANTAEIGSIGVVFSLRRRQDNSLEIVSAISPRKRPDPETDEGRRVLQERADAIAEVFVQAVMGNRNLTREQTLELQGNMTIAATAVEFGLADRIGSLEGLIAELQGNLQKGDGNMKLTFEQLKTEYAEIFEQAKEEGRAEIRQETETAKDQGKKEAQESMLALVEAVLGEDSKQSLDQVIQAGLTADQVKVSKDLFGKTASPESDEGDAQKKILDGIEAATPSPASPAAEGDEPKDFEQALKAYMQKHECSKGKAIKALKEEYPKLYQAWIDTANK